MKKEFKRGIVLVIGIIILVVSIKLIQNYDKIGKQLKEIGYSKEDVLVLKEKLNEEEMNKILSLEYHDNLVDIITHEYYIPYNLDTYLSYENENIDDLVKIVNVKANNDWYTNSVKADTTKGFSILVNKFHQLEEDFDPGEIVDISIQYAYDGHSINKEVERKYREMWNAAKEEGLTLIVNSSYRTYANQQKEYDVSNDDYAAKPGFSEHQTGLALDIVTYNTLGNSFEEKPEFAWLQNNAHKYGFILRYPKGKEYLTGYAYESWHYRYLGVDLATKVYESGLTYNEYYAYYCEYKNEC